MLNIHDLEKRHFHYKLKSYIPYVIIFFSITVIAGIMFTFVNRDVFSQDNKKVEMIQNTTEQKIEIKPEKVEQKKEVIKKEISNTIKKDSVITTPQYEKLTLTPSMNFIENINANSLGASSYKEPAKKEKITSQSIKIPKPKVEENRQIITKDEDSSIQIKKNNTYNDIQHVIKRFKKNNNPALSLFVAKKYYELGEYKKSYNYALRTNEINKDIEASWIIFAKSLVKLDKKEMAVKTLKKYINHSDSNKAKILLDEIISGKIDAN